MRATRLRSPSGVEPKDGWVDRLEEGRARWRLVQAKSAIRDAITDDPDRIADELRQAIDDGWRAVTGRDRDSEQ